MKKPRQFTSAQECVKNIFLSALLLLLALPTYGQIDWMQPTYLSEAKAYTGAASLGTKAYFAGGDDCNNSLFKVETYDVVTEEWDTTSWLLSLSRVVPAGVACDGKVFFAGGYDFDSEQFYNVVDIFDTQNGGHTVKHLSVKRVTSAVCKDSIVIFAGGLIHASFIDGSFTMTNVVDIYNTKKGNWVTTADDTLSVARDARTAVVVGDLAMFAGGHTGGPPGQRVSNRVDIYNFATGEWTIDSLSVARDRITATVVGDKALFAGGMTNDNERSDVVDIYNASTGEWEDVQHLSYPRAFSNNLCAATVCGKAVFAGGGNLDINTISWTDAYNVIDIYDPNTGNWTSDTLPEDRIEHAVVAVDSFLLIAGGSDNGCLSSVEIGYCLIDGVSSLDPESEFTIYPNPGSNHFTIDFGNNIQQTSSINIYNSIGQLVYSEEVQQGKSRQTLNLAHLTEGTYFLKLRIGEEQATQTLMIAH